MDGPLIYDGLAGVGRAAGSAVLMYAAVIAMIRISGKRTTSQLNNFDWVVTVAMGSIVASPILLDNVTIVESLTGLVVLMGLQMAVTRLSVTHDGFESLVKPSPTLIAYEGALMSDAMRRERISRAEVMAAVRGAGLASLSDAGAVILESDANLSVLPKTACEDCEELDVIDNVTGVTAIRSKGSDQGGPRTGQGG